MLTKATKAGETDGLDFANNATAEGDNVDTCYCHGCGDRYARSSMTAHNGDWYCDGCEAAPSEED